MYARAEVLALERRLHPFSIFLCSVVRSSVVLAARAGLSECRSSVGLGDRAEAWFCKSAGRVHSALEREVGRSSGSLWVAARAGCFTLERETGFKSRNLWLFKSLFAFSSLSYFSKITIVEPLTLDSTFSLGFDLVGVIYSPLAFTKKLLIVEGFILIWKSWVLEHVEFCRLLLWDSGFEVGISYSSLWILSLNFGILRCWGWFRNLVKVWGFCAILQKLGFYS